MSVSHLELCTATAGPQQHRGLEGEHTAEQLQHRRYSLEGDTGKMLGEETTEREKEVVNLQRVKMRNEKR